MGEYSIPDGVETVRGSAFEYCTNLTGIIFPVSLHTIESYAFYGCDNLNSAVIPRNVKTIESMGVGYGYYNDASYTVNSNFTVYGSAGSAAQAYSQQNGINFSPISEYLPAKTVAYNGHIYSLYNDTLDWNQAKTRCESVGGHLATITSQGEQDPLHQCLTLRA